MGVLYRQRKQLECTWVRIDFGCIASSFYRLHRFVPDGANGGNDPYIDFYVWDGSHAFVGTTADVSVRGGTDHTTNFSEESGRSSIDVSDLNDPPTLSVGNFVYNEGESTVKLNATDVIGSNDDISVTEVDIGDTLTVTGYYSNQLVSESCGSRRNRHQNLCGKQPSGCSQLQRYIWWYFVYRLYNLG